MFRKISKRISSKKHSAIPKSEATIKSPPKKAAGAGEAKASMPPAIIETPSKVQSTEKAAVAAPVRVTAAETVGTVCNRAAVASAILALRGADADLARDGALKLGALGDAAAVEPLIEALNNANGYYHCVVRAAAAWSLAQLGDARAFEPLCKAARDEMAEASAEAVRGLAAMGDRRAVVELIDIVRNPTGYFLSTVRLAAVSGLAQLAGDQAAAELARVANDGSEDPVIRETAQRGISASNH